MKMDRKEFFQNSGRWVIFGALGLLVGWLLANNRVASRSCEESSFCGGCNRFAGCNLPQAKKERQNGRQG